MMNGFKNKWMSYKLQCHKCHKVHAYCKCPFWACVIIRFRLLDYMESKLIWGFLSYQRNLHTCILALFISADLSFFRAIRSSPQH